ncbi:hypothetical protein COO60DRAFT_1203409 [Scenedesmus sp. NREL 46B-D3]|nr:hypothetical protein COO60DRAFT_1203409 [Scenedesmus sp. NREL 46B-D3]
MAVATTSVPCSAACAFALPQGQRWMGTRPRSCSPCEYHLAQMHFTTPHAGTFTVLYTDIKADHGHLHSLHLHTVSLMPQPASSMNWVRMPLTQWRVLGPPRVNRQSPHIAQQSYPAPEQKEPPTKACQQHQVVGHQPPPHPGQPQPQQPSTAQLQQRC